MTVNLVQFFIFLNYFFNASIYELCEVITREQLLVVWHSVSKFQLSLFIQFET